MSFFHKNSCYCKQTGFKSLFFGKSIFGKDKNLHNNLELNRASSFFTFGKNKVLNNHFISYKNPSFLGEELETQTWIDNYEGVKSERHYKIIRPADGKTIVEATTLWCFLDAKTFRPTKITEEISNLFI